jgi:hypothetical protein
MKTQPKTSQKDFPLITEQIPNRLIWVSSGREKVGKNHFGLTGPGPIFGQYFDPGGVEGVAQKFLKAPLGPKEIRAMRRSFGKCADSLNLLGNRLVAGNTAR